MRRSVARFLAPVALAAVVLSVVIVVKDSGAGPKATATTRPAPIHRPLHRTYVVRTGDSLSRIAVRNGVSVTTLEQLNPNLDPNALRPGQRLKLRQ